MEEYGLFYSVSAFLSLLSLFARLGLNTAFVKHIPELLHKKQFSSIKSSLCIIALIQLSVYLVVIGIVLFLIPVWVATNIFHTINSIIVMQVLVIGVILSIFFRLFESIFQGYQNMLHFSMVEFSRVFIMFLSVLLLSRLGAFGAALANLTSSILITIIFFALYHFGYPQISRSKIKFTRDVIKNTRDQKKLLTFGGWIFGAISVGVMLEYLDTVFLTSMRSLSEASLYQIAFPISQIIWFIPSGIIVILFPIVSELWIKGLKDELNKNLRIIIKFTFIMIIPLVAMMVSFSELIIRIIFGEKFIAAALPLQILAIGAVFYSMIPILSIVLTGISKPKITFLITAMMAGIAVALNYIFIPKYGILAASVISAAVFFIGMIASFLAVKKYLKDIRVPFFDLLKIVLGGIFMILFIIFLKGILNFDPIVEAVLCFITGIFVYMLCIIYTRCVTQEDLRVLSFIKPYIPAKIWRIISKMVKE